MISIRVSVFIVRYGNESKAPKREFISRNYTSKMGFRLIETFGLLRQGEDASFFDKLDFPKMKSTLHQKNLFWGYHFVKSI